MKNYRLIQTMLLGAMTCFYVFTSCSEKYDIQRVEPSLDVQESVTTEPQSERLVMPLKSSYPWFAEASDGWISLTRYRGQALKADSIVFSCEENPTMDDREGYIEVRLMDQYSQRIKVVQRGRGTLITLPQSLVYFNKQGGEVLVEVQTHLDWQPEVASKDGFTFTKADKTHLKVVATANPTGKDRTSEVVIYDKDKKKSAKLSIIQKPTDKILFIPFEAAQKDLVIKKGEYSLDIPVTLNVEYDAVASDKWIKIKSAPPADGKSVQNILVSTEVETNTTGQERSGYIVIKNKGSKTEASDTIFITQRGVGQIIYVKPGGNGDGTSWERAFGSIHDAMGAASNNGDMEIWVASGTYQFKASLTWKHVNVYGGFKGTENKLHLRDLKNKPVFVGGERKFMAAWNNTGAMVWMDGIVFADCDNYRNTDTGCFEIYMNHGFRNCEFRNLRHGRQIFYMQKCKMVNCYLHDLHSKNYIVRGDGTNFYNCTLVSSMSDGWNTNYVSGGCKWFNSVIWAIKRTAGTGYRAFVAGQATMTNCAVHSGIKEKNIKFIDCFELNLNNDADNGPKFVNPVVNGDYRLKAGSKCIDAGKKVDIQLPYDIMGNPRVVGSSIDMGAFEYNGK